jgi:Glucodextranase, domain B
MPAGRGADSLGRVRRSVVPRAALAFAALISVALASCGDTDEQEAVCDTVKAATVAAELRSAGADVDGSLRPRADESPGLSVCSYRSGDTSVRVSRDTAPQAPLRYFHRITEQFEFHAGDPRREPHLVFGVGDDRRAFGGAGSYWLPANGQLISLRDDRLVIVTVAARGVGGRGTQRAAERLALRVFGGGKLAERGARRGAGAERGMTIVTPRDGAEVREGQVLVEGTVAPPDATVRVAGRPARTRSGVFKARVPLDRGSNRIEIAGAADGREIGRKALTVNRLAPADEAAARIAAGYDGHVPDIRGERLDIVRSAFRNIGLRVDEVQLTRGRVEPKAWAACGTRPLTGERAPRAKPVILFVARRRLDRSSGTACRGKH